MKRVDFYLLKQDNPQARYPFACRLIEKGYHLGHKLYIHCADQKEAHKLDDLLWCYKDASFIPHNLNGEGPTPPPPVQIGFNADPNGFNDILINLDTTIPEFYQRFNRLIEIVPTEPSWRNKLREHYRFLRDKDFEIKTHEIT